ncbi:MAG: ABC transporter substrate-binding protein [Anaerolineales bacterium]|nr:ABC transporter substrate-binding protein [Anaerolineales bacterium]
MTNRKISFIILAFLWVFTACTPPSQPTPESTTAPASTLLPVQDGPSLPIGPTALWIGWLNGPDSPNPFVAQWSASYNIFDLVYSSLYRLSLDGTYIPDLVENSFVSPNQHIWTFTIRSGVKFHDNIPLTARDVAFSLNLYKKFPEVNALNETTVEIRLTDPIPNMEGHLANLYILPQHIWDRYENALDTFDNLEMIGSGPFKMEIYAPESFVYLKAVPDHYAYPPKIDDLVFYNFPDETSLKEALVTGDVQLIYTLPYFEVASLADTPNIEVVTGQPLYSGFEEIVFNQLNPKDCPTTASYSAPASTPEDINVTLCSGHPALRDQTVREAMSYAVDKVTLINQALHGRGTPGVSIIPLGLEHFFDPMLKDYAYDPALANDKLDQAGYLDTNGDHIREMPTNSPDPGRPLSFRLYYPGPSVYYEQIIAELDRMWQAIGIELIVREMDAEPLTYLCCPTFDFDLILWGWSVEPEPGDIFDIFSTSKIPSGYNEAGFSDPDYDILNAIQHTEIDTTKRLEILWEMQRIIHDQAATLVLYYPEAVAAYRSDQFTGWITDATHLALEDFSSLTQIEPVK